MKQKIQVTTAEIKAPAQVVLPNTYFVTKAVKAMLATEELKDLTEHMRSTGQIHDEQVILPVQLVDKVNELAHGFLTELINALEGEEPENNSSSSQGV